MLPPAVIQPQLQEERAAEQASKDDSAQSEEDEGEEEEEEEDEEEEQTQEDYLPTAEEMEVERVPSPELRKRYVQMLQDLKHYQANQSKKTKRTGLKPSQVAHQNRTEKEDSPNSESEEEYEQLQSKTPGLKKPRVEPSQPAVLKDTGEARKFAGNLAAALSRTSPLLSLNEKATDKMFRLWVIESADLAQAHFGSEWLSIEEALQPLARTFKGTLKEDWLELKAQRLEDKEPTPESLGWKWITTWAKSHLDKEVKDEELEARQLMLSGNLTQGSKSVTDYINRLQRVARKIPKVGDMDMIVWFLHGISDSLKHTCQCDVRGKTWTVFESLREHALAKEMEENSRRNIPVYQTKTPFGIRKAHVAQARSRMDRNEHPRTQSISFMDARDTPKERHEGGESAKRRPRERTEPAAVAGKFKHQTPRFPEPAEDPCEDNKFISNRQANWLWGKRKCIHCGQALHRDKEKKILQCPSHGKYMNLQFLQNEGLPKNQLNP